MSDLMLNFHSKYSILSGILISAVWLPCMPGSSDPVKDEDSSLTPCSCCQCLAWPPGEECPEHHRGTEHENQG